MYILTGFWNDFSLSIYDILYIYIDVLASRMWRDGLDASTWRSKQYCRDNQNASRVFYSEAEGST